MAKKVPQAPDAVDQQADRPEIPPGMMLVGSHITGEWKLVDREELRRRVALEKALRARTRLLLEANTRSKRARIETRLLERKVKHAKKKSQTPKTLGRQSQATRDLEESLEHFFRTVWPKIRPRYGRPGWREEAHELLGITDRTLDRYLAEGRRRGLVPPLRARPGS